MADINLEAVAGKLNRIGYEAFFKALRQAKGAGNRNVELAHWLLHLLQGERTDIGLTADHFGLDRNKLLMDINAAIAGFRRNETEMPTVSNTVMDLLDRGWHYATLFFGETQIRTGHVLVGAMQSRDLDRALKNISSEFNKMSVDVLTSQYRKIWAASEEETLRPMDNSGLGPAASAGPQTSGAKGTTPLDRFSQDLTAKARSGEMDPILGRDDEIRQLIDVLMRRRQNNPILTGEAGVGKTAVVEGFAQRIASGEIPPPLKNVRLCALDIGLMQAGASMKGEFEQRLRSVIDEVQGSPTPIILFIDEAHTLIGAGGSAGTGDAANLLKPPLARGTLRTIAATTWAEYRQYIEKDPALNSTLPAHPGRRARRRDLLHHAARSPWADGKASWRADFGRRDRCGRESVAPLYSGAAVAGQGGQPPGHCRGPGGDQPERDAGPGRGRACRHCRAQGGANCARQRRRSRNRRRRSHGKP